MFLVAVTNEAIASNLNNYTVDEYVVNSYKVTIITDNFLSKYMIKPDGFLVTESPFAQSPSDPDLVISEVEYVKEADLIEVNRPTVYGRSIFYHINQKGEFFCSTHISMLRRAGVAIEENTEVIPELLVYDLIVPPQTLYKNIYQLHTGGRLEVKITNLKCTIQSASYYIPPIKSKQFHSLDAVVEQTSYHLARSLKVLNNFQDMAAVLLSGGLDSSILFKISQNDYEIDSSYSSGYPFESPGKNLEKKYALSAANTFNAKHKYYEATTREYLFGFLEAIYAAEQPLHHLQSVLFYLLFKNGISQDHCILINGTGADTSWGELLLYNLNRIRKWPYKILLQYPILRLLELISPVTGKTQRIVDFLNKAREYVTTGDPNNIIWSMGKYGDDEWVCQYLGVTKGQVIKNRFGIIKPFLKYTLFDILSLLDLQWDLSFTQSIWLKIGESQGKILYYPYGYHELLDYAYSIPWSMKLTESKAILRNVARRLEIPEFIVSRRKSSFGVVRKGWAERGDVFEPLVPLAAKVFDEGEIRSIQSTDPVKAMTFWNILNYSIWKRLHINNEPIESILEELTYYLN